MLRCTKQQNQTNYYTRILGNKWKRLFHIIRDYHRSPQHWSIGLSFLMHVTSHAGFTVFNSTFLITTGHSYYGEITQLASTGYSKFNIRIICSDYGEVYIDILDNSSGHAISSPESEMGLEITISKLSNAIIQTIDQYVEEDDIPAGCRLIETMETKGYYMIVSSITEKKTSS